MKRRVMVMLLCCILAVGMLTGCGSSQASFGSGKSRTITVNTLNKKINMNNVRFYDYMSNAAKTKFTGTYYAASSLGVGSNELTFAGNGKTYVAKVNICSDKLVVRYTKAGSTDTYKKM